VKQVSFVAHRSHQDRLEAMELAHMKFQAQKLAPLPENLTSVGVWQVTKKPTCQCPSVLWLDQASHPLMQVHWSAQPGSARLPSSSLGLGWWLVSLALDAVVCHAVCPRSLPHHVATERQLLLQLLLLGVLQATRPHATSMVAVPTLAPQAD